ISPVFTGVTSISSINSTCCQAAPSHTAASNEPEPMKSCMAYSNESCTLLAPVRSYTGERSLTRFTWPDPAPSSSKIAALVAKFGPRGITFEPKVQSATPDSITVDQPAGTEAPSKSSDSLKIPKPPTQNTSG